MINVIDFAKIVAGFLLIMSGVYFFTDQTHTFIAAFDIFAGLFLIWNSVDRFRVDPFDDDDDDNLEPRTV